jgi:hypothetical integral membrane protein (TIGR02206 family)
MAHTLLEPFSHLWYLYTSIVILGIVVLVLVLRKRKNLSKIATIIGYIILIQIILTNIYLLFVTKARSLHDSLPLSLCRASIILSALALITRKQFFITRAVYLGISGGIQSILTPDFSYGNSIYITIDYYFVHGIMIFIPIFLIYIMKFRLSKFSSLKAFLYGNILLAIIFPLNFLIGSNYMYLKEKPLVDNILLVGNWPRYIIAFEVAAIIHILIMDVIFRIIPNHVDKKIC